MCRLGNGRYSKPLEPESIQGSAAGAKDQERPCARPRPRNGARRRSENDEHRPIQALGDAQPDQWSDGQPLDHGAGGQAARGAASAAPEAVLDERTAAAAVEDAASHAGW